MITLHRREALKGAAATGFAAMSGIWPAAGAAATGVTGSPFVPRHGPRSRVLFVNDLSGDLDGLYALVHQILSPSAELRAIVGTTTGSPGETAQRSAELATEILDIMGRRGSAKVHVGAPGKLTSATSPVRSPGTQAIIDEAMRNDTQLPLYVAVGGGLTEIASALMLEPGIADRLTLVWIGGDAYPAGATGETNFNIDPIAAQYVYNSSNVRLWQVPRAVYATTVVSATEIQARVAPHGRIGAWLYQKIVDAPSVVANGRLNTGESWTMGDNPLVSLTALTDWGPSSYRPSFLYERTRSSLFDEVTAPRLNPDGTFTTRSEGRKIRIYKSIDTRLMFEDMFAKLRVNFPTSQGDKTDG